MILPNLIVSYRNIEIGVFPNISFAVQFKGSVQRKLRWVENGVNRCVGASDCGAGHSFVVLFRFHLGLSIFLFPVSTAEFIGEFWKNKRSATSDVAPIDFCA